MVSRYRHVDASALQILGNIDSGNSRAYRTALANKTLFVEHSVGEKQAFRDSEEKKQKSRAIVRVSMRGRHD